MQSGPSLSSRCGNYQKAVQGRHDDEGSCGAEVDDSTRRRGWRWDGIVLQERQEDLSHAVAKLLLQPATLLCAQLAKVGLTNPSQSAVSLRRTDPHPSSPPNVGPRQGKR